MDRLTGVGDRGLARVVVAYDIGDDLRRERASQALLDLLGRVEYSLFDAWVPDERVGDLWRSVAPELRPRSDRAFVVRLCDACAKQAGAVGRGPVADPPGTSWVV